MSKLLTLIKVPGNTLKPISMFVKQLSKERDIAMPSDIKQFTQEKLNVVNNQIQQAELEIFNHEITIKDAEVNTGNDKLDSELRQHADKARISTMAWERKLVVRRALKVQLEETLKALTPVSTSE